MRVTTFLILATLVMLSPTAALASPQRAASPEEERAAWREAARAIPPGTVVRVELVSKRRVTGVLVTATSEGLLIKERGRSERPALWIPLAEVARIERAGKEGMSLVKAIAAGTAAGAGAFFTFLAISLIVFSD